VAGWLAGPEVIIRLTQSSWARAGTELGNRLIYNCVTTHLVELKTENKPSRLTYYQDVNPFIFLFFLDRSVCVGCM
jgi:hypothetical protein